MKLSLVIFVFMASAYTAEAQFWNELFRQKKTQKKYLLQQIAALKQYAMLLKNGYRVVNEGLTFINDVKHGHFTLDNRYFQSLKIVNPSVKGGIGLQTIDDQLQSLSQIRSSCITYCKKYSAYNAVDIGLVDHSYNVLITKAAEYKVAFKQLNTDLLFNMSDNDRAERMIDLLQQVENLVAFACKFDRTTRQYAEATAREKVAIQSLADWYGLN
jgi:hypothetical protein